MTESGMMGDPWAKTTLTETQWSAWPSARDTLGQVRKKLGSWGGATKVGSGQTMVHCCPGTRRARPAKCAVSQGNSVDLGQVDLADSPTISSQCDSLAETPRPTPAQRSSQRCGDRQNSSAPLVTPTHRHSTTDRTLSGHLRPAAHSARQNCTNSPQHPATAHGWDDHPPHPLRGRARRASGPRYSAGRREGGLTERRQTGPSAKGGALTPGEIHTRPNSDRDCPRSIRSAVQ